MAGHTEKEAAELWCPHFRGNLAKVADVAMIDGNQDGHCIGSRCSQWRWFDDEIMKHTEYTATISMSSTPEQAKKAFCDDVPLRDMMAAGYAPADQAIPATGIWCLTLTKPSGAERRGFCGLAGRP